MQIQRSAACWRRRRYPLGGRLPVWKKDPDGALAQVQHTNLKDLAAFKLPSRHQTHSYQPFSTVMWLCSWNSSMASRQRSNLCLKWCLWPRLSCVCKQIIIVALTGASMSKPGHRHALCPYPAASGVTAADAPPALHTWQASAPPPSCGMSCADISRHALTHYWQLPTVGTELRL